MNVEQLDKQKSPEKISPSHPDGEIFETVDVVAQSVEDRNHIFTHKNTSSPEKEDNKEFSFGGIFSDTLENKTNDDSSTLQNIAKYGGGIWAVKKLWESAVENSTYTMRNFFSKLSFGLIKKPKKQPKESFFGTVKKVGIWLGIANGVAWLEKKFSWGTKLKEKIFGGASTKSATSSEKNKTQEKPWWQFWNTNSQEKKSLSMEKFPSLITQTPGKFLGVSYTGMDPFFANTLRGYEKERSRIYTKIVKNPQKISRLQAAQKIFRNSKILPPFLREFCPFIPFQESYGYNLSAKSVLGAGGPWQFMPKTGKQYGLSGREFNDPKKSALAARKFLEDIYTDIQNNKYFKILANRYPDQKESLHNFTTVSSYNTGKGNIFSAFKVLATEEKFRETVDTAAQKPFGIFSLLIQANNSSSGWRKYAPKKKNGNYGKQSREYVPHILGFYQLGKKQGIA